jgi:hypothetical protein
MTVFAWLVSFGLLASPVNVITFDRESLGKTPPGWTIPMNYRGAAPRWQIVHDPTAPTRPYVLAQVATDTHTDRFPLAILDRISMRDGDLSVRLKPVSGLHDQVGGLVFRYRDEKNYYVVRADAMGDDVALYRVENGRHVPILPRGMPPSSFEVKHNIPANAWQILKVSFRGNQFQVYVNHRRLFQAQDSAYVGPGKVGLCTAADSVTYFNDFRVSPK